MFLDNLSKKTLNTIGIISIVLATIMLILVIVLPILLKRQLKKNFIEKCNPSMENTDLWASFPGELTSKLLHTFTFYDYEETNEKDKLYKINFKSNVTIEEQVKYTNFSKEDTTIYFYNNRTYRNANNKTENEETPIKSINFGMFEAFETMSFPPLYKAGIDSIYYLKKKVLIESEPDLFIRELFTYNLTKRLSLQDISFNVLAEVSPKKIDLILNSSYSKYTKYSLNESSGFFEWVKILGSQEKISNSKWLTNLFLLTESEINSVLLNEDSYLVQEFEKFNKYLAEKFKCQNEIKCGDELIYKQLIDSSVISGLFNDIKTYKELNDYLSSNYYPFETSPEMKTYFDNEYSKQKSHKSKYEEVSIKKEQLEKFLKDESNYNLLALENTLNILHINKTADSKKDIKYFDDLTYDNVNFLANYFYDYLPKILLYPQKSTQQIKNPEKNSLNEADDSNSYGLISKIVSNLLPKIAEQTYNKLSNIDILTYLEQNMSFAQMKELLKNYELEEICPIIMQKSLNDEKKVFALCSDENLNLTDKDIFNKFIQLYYCQEETKDEEKCDDWLAVYLKSLNVTKKIFISDAEIASLVSKDSIIGQIVLATHDSLVTKYNCPGPCTNEYLLRLQFTKANVTRDPPGDMEKADNLSTWFPELEDDYEIINIKKKYENEDPFEDQDAYWIIDTQIKEGDLHDLDNTDSFMNKIKFEKKYENDLMNKPETSTLVKLIDFLLGIYIFNSNKNAALIVNYTSIDNFLKGNSEENQYWIDYLQSGNYFENFKPKISEVTKFDFGFNFDTKEEQDLNLDYLGISTKTTDYDKRRIDKMNDLLTLNIKKDDYDITKDSYTNLNFSLYNFENLLGERKFCDGFQYDNSLEIIYYYDLISSRPLCFRRKEDVKYKDKVECKKYYLETDDFSDNINENLDIDSKNAMLNQKVNKPFMLKFDTAESLKKFGYEVGDDIEVEENYICVDPITDMVIDSKMNFMYTLNSRKYGLLNKKIEKDAIYPLFHYQRSYEVNVDSYEKQFPGVTEFYENSTTLIIVGVVLIVIFVSVALVAFIYLNKKLKQERTGGELIDSLEPLKENLETKTDEDKNLEDK